MSGNTLNLKIFFQEKMYKNIRITRMVYLTIAKDSYLKFVSVYFECVYILNISRGTSFYVFYSNAKHFAYFK